MKMRGRAGICALLLLLPVVMSLSACGAEGKDPGKIDYNQYIYGHGRTAYTENSYIFMSRGGKVSALEPTLSAPLTPLCLRPECTHTDNTCSAYLNTDSVFASGDALYYLAQDENREYGVYRADLNGGGRKCIRKLPMLDQGGIGFTYRIYGDHLALAVTRWSKDTKSDMIYLADLSDPNSEIELILGGEDNTQTSYGTVELRDGWLFVEAYERSAMTRSLIGYNMEKGESRTIVEDWNPYSWIALRGDILYWFAPGDGFYSISLESGEITKYRDCDPVVEMGSGRYDDQYVYFTNMIPVIERERTVPENKLGVYIYNYEGEQIQYIPAAEVPGNPLFLLPTEDYVFFYDAKGAIMPKWYLKKAEIARGEAVFHTLPE